MKTKRIIYQEIATRKNDINNTIQKATNQMTKVLRELLSKNHSSAKCIKINESPLPEAEKPKFIQSRQML